MINLDNTCSLDKCCCCEYENHCDFTKEFKLANTEVIKHRLVFGEHSANDKCEMYRVLDGYKNGWLKEEKEIMNENKETKTYEQGLEEAWEIVRKIVTNCEGCFKPWDLGDIFDGNSTYQDVLKKYPSIYEVKAKIDAWEAEKNKPKLGDVVEVYGGSGEYYYTGIFIEEKEKGYIILTKSLYHTQTFSKSTFILEKTGKHFDIQSMLDEISGK